MRWRTTAEESAQLLGLQVERSGLGGTRLRGSVDGFEIQVGCSSGEVSTIWFKIPLPGWPTTTGFSLRYVPIWKGFRRRIRFDDAEWEKLFTVRAQDPEMLRLHLTQKRRDAIRKWFESHLYKDSPDFNDLHPRD